MRNAFAKRLMQETAERLGYEIHNASIGSAARRRQAMRVRGVDLVLDVGANVGQYALGLRRSGYSGRIVSFEPLPQAYASLLARSGADDYWSSEPIALGAIAGTAELNVSASSVLSSLLPPAPALRSHLPGASFSSQVTIDVRTLDDIWLEVVRPSETTLLKIDTQGFEHQVLDGAAASLASVELVEIEASLIPTYEGGSSVHDMLPRIKAEGFELIAIDCLGGYIDPQTGQALDVNILAGRPLP